jgi:uncharacterized SAM-binding protein YcdF (DUF218 family)
MASAWAPFALVGALTGARPLRLALGVVTIAVVGVWTVVAFTPVTSTITASLLRRDAPAPGDAVFVLASRLQRDGEPTAVAAARLLKGLEIISRGRAGRLVVTEVASSASAPHRRLAVQEAARLGVDIEEIVSLGPVASTRDEAVRVGGLCRERGWRRLIVVTSPLHARRACGAVEGQGVGVVCSPAVETRYDLENLDRPVERLRAFRAAVREALALWLYTRRGWIQGRGASPGDARYGDEYAGSSIT